ncbi:EAL domain-containing protein [Sphingomonas koreensis]|nr:EAL domain-containing protein [Sphingomonas koreensis]
MMFAAPSDPPRTAPPALLALFALRDDDQGGLATVDGEQPLRHLSASWTVALVAQLIAMIAVIMGVIIAGPRDLMPSIAIDTGIATLIGIAMLALLRIGAARRWPTHVQTQLLVPASAALVVSLLWLAHLSGYLGNDTWRFACFVAAFGSIGVTAVALYAVRAAILSFALGMVGVTIVLSGMSPASSIAIIFLLALAIVAYRLAIIDHAAAHARALAENDGKLAARLVEEFESHGSGWFWQTDRQGRLTYLSHKVARELTSNGAAPIGRPLTTLFRMDAAGPSTERTLGFHLTSRTAFSDYSVQAAENQVADRWWSISGRPITDERGSFHGFIGSGSDLTEKRRSEAEITRLALFDGLTGLANRQRMKLSLDQTLAQGNGPYRPTALFLLDLDRFKAVNDTLGHQTGDALLQQVGKRLLRAVGDAGLVGRLGGDEFQVVLPGESNRDRLAELAKTVIAALSHPYFIDGGSISIGCSIGIAVAPGDGDKSEALVRNADLALYAAKADGRGIHRFYRAELLKGAQTRKQLEDDLRHALANDQFHVAYQPVVSTAGERIVGYEALLRWDHPTRGSVSPAEFIPVAEDCGLVESIGEWVLRTACLEAARWPDTVRVGVNVSPIQFANPALPAVVTSALARSGIAAGRLELEITESVFVDDTASTEAMFKKLKGLGVRLALDDFGTGYSSLGYLKKAPFDKIKIDQSFVRGAAVAGNRNAAIIKAIVMLADTLGMETTAEGVEVQDEIALIRELGCSHIQGFVYGKPARAEEVIKQLAAAGGHATASGYKVSRSPRTTMLRSARIEMGDATGEVRIRNISSTGAMIDGIEIDGEAIGLDLLIELLDSEMFPAKLRWARDGKAGIEFAENFNLERLNTSANPRSIRRTG